MAERLSDERLVGGSQQRMDRVCLRPDTKSRHANRPVLHTAERPQHLLPDHMHERWDHQRRSRSSGRCARRTHSRGTVQQRLRCRHHQPDLRESDSHRPISVRLSWNLHSLDGLCPQGQAVQHRKLFGRTQHRSLPLAERQSDCFPEDCEGTGHHHRLPPEHLLLRPRADDRLRLQLLALLVQHRPHTWPG